jgi:hypothetical protein
VPRDFSSRLWIVNWVICAFILVASIIPLPFLSFSLSRFFLFLIVTFASFRKTTLEDYVSILLPLSRSLTILIAIYSTFRVANAFRQSLSRPLSQLTLANSPLLVSSLSAWNEDFEQFRCIMITLRFVPRHQQTARTIDFKTPANRHHWFLFIFFFALFFVRLSVFRSHSSLPSKSDFPFIIIFGSSSMRKSVTFLLSSLALWSLWSKAMLSIRPLQFIGNFRCAFGSPATKLNLLPFSVSFSFVFFHRLLSSASLIVRLARFGSVATAVSDGRHLLHG